MDPANKTRLFLLPAARAVALLLRLDEVVEAHAELGLDLGRHVFVRALRGVLRQKKMRARAMLRPRVVCAQASAWSCVTGIDLDQVAFLDCGDRLKPCAGLSAA